MSRRPATTCCALSALVAVALAAPRAARADDKAACIAESEKAQSLRDQRELLEARALFIECARDVCPAAVRKDCVDQVADVVKRTPSVVFHAKDKSGQDLVAVKVTSDGKVLTEQLDGRSIPLDPGVHTFRFEAAGNETFEQKIVLAEGEHDRPVTARFGIGAVEASAGGGPATTTAAPKHKGAPIGAFVVGGLGVLAMGLGAAFYASAFAERSSYQSPGGCAPPFGTGCSPSEIDSIHTQLVVGDVVFYTGVAALAGGVIWAIVHYASGGKERSAPTATVGVAPTALGRGAVASTTIRW